jgi:hypothetical protein
MPRKRCDWCGAGFATSQGPGRPSRYCRRSHRQRAYEARQLAAVHQLGLDDVLVSAGLLAELQDAVYVIETALEDIDRDLAEVDNPQDHRDALWHLYGAAAGLRAIRIEPKAVGATERP